MRVVLTRDSVCMGDDVRAPHESGWDAADTITLPDLLEQAARPLLHLPTAPWLLHLGYNRAAGEPLAVTAPQWQSPRLLPAGAAAGLLDAGRDRLELFWAYRPWDYPEELYQQLSASQQQTAAGPTPPPH